LEKGLWQLCLKLLQAWCGEVMAVHKRDTLQRYQREVS
jgi:hypothetical protein